MLNLNLDAAVPEGIIPRSWQWPALQAIAATDSPAPLIEAVMGSGKSILIVMLVRAAIAGGGGRICVAAPTEALVEQLAADLIKYVGRDRVGRYYGRIKEPGKQVIVTCFPSMEALATEDVAEWDLWICDECHLSQTEREVRSFEVLNPKWRVGFSATPYRSDDIALSLWDRVVYSYKIGDALKDGVLVPWQTIYPDEGGIDIDTACLDMLKKHMPVTPGIIGAKSIVDAEGFAEFLIDNWGPVAPIHSGLADRIKDRRLKDLEKGNLKALVHVDILTTGVNLPWLGWLMLRRRYKSRTSFLQFFGRGLRSHPGKEQAIIFDPWMQMQDFALDYEVLLGGEAKFKEKKVTIPQDEIDFTLIELPEMDEKLMLPKLTARNAVSAWIRAVLQAAQAAKIVKPSEWSPDSAWRKKKGTPKQLAAVEKLAWAGRHLPRGLVRDGVKAVISVKDAHSAGTLSDLMDILVGCASHGKPYRDQKRHWEWELLTDIPALPKRVAKALAQFD